MAKVLLHSLLVNEKIGKLLQLIQNRIQRMDIIYVP